MPRYEVLAETSHDMISSAVPYCVAFSCPVLLCHVSSCSAVQCNAMRGVIDDMYVNDHAIY